MKRKRKLPLGIQTFRTFREEGCYYVDKTAYAKRLVDEGGRYFLSRPRRFGKSLFLDTLKELFAGGEELFRGLHVHDRWDWSVRHPVARLSFGAGDFRDPDHLRADVLAQLDGLAPTKRRLAAPLGAQPDRSRSPRRSTTQTPGTRSAGRAPPRRGNRAVPPPAAVVARARRAAVVVLVDEYESRSWTRWRTRPPRAPTASTCAGCTA